MPSLYVTEPGARIAIATGRIVVEQGNELVLSVPAVRVDQVVMVGGANITAPALNFLADRGIDLVLITAGGDFRARLSADRAIPYDLRRRQYERAADPTFCLAIGRAILEGKIRNSRTRLMKQDATNDDPAIAAAVADLKELLDRLPTAPDIAALMGIEGQAARVYFAALRYHLREPWQLPARARRPPPDPVNSLLSAVYTLLHERCRTALAIAGLDPLCGFLHQPRPGRASLGLDLMEEFRPVIADAVALTLLNKRMLTPADFRPALGGKGVHLTPAGWRELAAQFETRLRTGLRVPGRSTPTTYQKLLEAQARRLRAAIQDGEAGYEPYLSK